MAAPAPNVGRSDVTNWKGIFQKPSLTSFFQCWFYPTEATKTWLKQRDFDFKIYEENISFLCAEAALPGSQLMTNEITNDYHGVTERHPYRRQFNEQAEFTFYVDHYGTKGPGGAGKSHNVVWMFDNWIQHIVDESIDPVGDRPTSESKQYFYRAAFPSTYQTDIYLNKFERDFTGTYLEYRFLQAYPLAMASMPVSYDASSVLKCTVSFSFTRYIVKRKTYSAIGGLRDNPLFNNLPAEVNPFRTRVDENILQTFGAYADSVGAFFRY